MGKKGANKLAKMSDEERARYLQHRAEIEEEARRRKQYLIALFMKNKLKREEAFCRLNLAKINQEWRAILRQIKCQELKNEIAEVEKLFGESFDQKNRTIMRLLNALDQAEELYSSLQQNHIEDIERLIGIQQRRMGFWKDRYLKEKNSILNEFKEDFNENQTSREKSQIELECVFYSLQDAAEKRLKQNEEEHLIKCDDLRSRMIIQLEEITKSREQQLDKLWKEYQQVLDDYIRYTETFHAEYLELRESDDENTKIIRQHCYEVAKATNQITELKLQLDVETEEHDFRINYLERYRDDLKEQFLYAKKSLEENLQSNKKLFKFMAVQSQTVINRLKSAKKKGESILQLESACRKLESEREKVLPFGYSDRLQKATNTQMYIDELRQPPNEFKNIVSGMWINLENFWYRVNSVKLDVTFLNEEKFHLKRENEELKNQLKNYLTKVTLNSSNNDIAQKRLLKRPSSMQIEKLIHIDVKDQDVEDSQRFPRRKHLLKKLRPVTCIEGNLSNAIRSLKLSEGKLNTVKIKSFVNNW